MKRVMIAALLCASSAVPVMAQAQDGDVLVMRRAIAQPTGKVTIPPSPDFVRVPLKVKDSGVTTYALNGTLKLEIEEVGCRITDGSIIIDEATCAIGQGPQVGDIINFTAKMDPDLKAYYVPREQYEEILPAFSQQAIDALCSGSALVSGSAFSGSCNPEAVVNTYAKFINALDDPISGSMPQNVSSSDVLNFYVSSVGCYSTQTGSVVSPSTCANITKSPAEIHAIPATYIPQLREVFLDTADIDSMSPAPAIILKKNLSTFCTSTDPKIRVDNQDWVVRCGEPDDPSDYKRTVVMFNDPIMFGPATNRIPNDSSSGDFRMVVQSTGCLDQSGNTVTGKCDFLTRGPDIYDIVTIPATYIPDLREIYVNQADLVAAAGQDNPIIVTRRIAEACTGKYTKFKVIHEGVENDWTFNCGEPDDPSDYKRTVVMFNDPIMFGPATNRIPNNSTSGEFRMVVQSTGCLDQSGNEVTGKCDFLTSGPDIYDIVTIPATYIPNLREIYVNQADLVAAAGQDNPVIVTRRIADACTGKYTKIKVIHEGVASDWSFNCGEPDDSSDYKRTVVKFNDPMMFGPMTNRIPNNSSSGEFRMVVQSTGCLDQSGNEVTGKCDYLPEGPSLYDQVTVPAVYVTDLRELYVDRNDIEAAAGNFGPYASTRPIMGNKTLTDACNGNGFNVQVMGQGRSNEWTFHCGMADDPANYTRTARQLFDPVNFGSERTPNDPDSGVLRMVVRVIGCLDKAGNEVPGKCNYLPDGPNVYDFLSVPATYVPELRKVYIDRADIETMAGNPNPMIVNYALADACVNGKISFRADGMDWGFRCGAAEDPDNFEMKAQALRDPRDYGSARSTNMDPNATKLGLSVASTVCLDKTTNSTTDTSTCAYLPGRVSAQDILWMPAVFDASAKTITIDPEAFRALGHDTSLDYNHNSTMCGRNITIDVNYQDFRVLCSS